MSSRRAALMGSRSKRILAWGMVSLVGAVLLYAAIRQPVRSPEALTIATATPGGTYEVFGGSLARILSQQTDEGFPPVTAQETAGSGENVQLLVDQSADLGLAQRRTLLEISPEDRGKLAVLADLYHDVVQVVVRRDAGVQRLGDFAGKRVYIGREESGTQVIALEVLARAGLVVTDAMRAGTAQDGYSDAARKLRQGIIDGAFFASGTPTDAVGDAMASGCCELLDLDADMAALEGISDFGDKYAAAVVPAALYQNQRSPVRTLSTVVHLVSQRELSDAAASRVVDALYDNIRELLRVHTRAAEDIAYRPPEPNVVDVHPGVSAFWNRQRDTLLIATGAIDGIYYSMGTAIKRVLDAKKIPSRVLHTEGSLENLELLRQGKTIALMQYEVALAAHWGGETRPIYGSAVNVPSLPRLRRIATLREEKLHPVVRRDRLGDSPPTLGALSGMRLAVGPNGSGSQLLAHALLDDLEIEAIRLPLPVGSMVDQLRGGLIDAALFTTGVPSQSLRRLLSDPSMRLLSVEPHRMNGLGGGLTMSTIEEGTYGSQLEGEPEVLTVGTQSVLVTTADLSESTVGQITSALFEGSDFLPMDGGAESLAADLPSIPLHPGAVNSYQERSLLPAEPAEFLEIPLELWLNWIRIIGQGLLILVTLVGTYHGVLKLKRDRTAHAVGRRVFGISVEASEPQSVRQLLSIRREIRERVKRRWWQQGEIDKERWRVLEGLVNLGIHEAKEYLERALVAEIRLRPGGGHETSTARGAHHAALRERIWTHLERGELDAEQHGRLLAILDDSEPPAVDAGATVSAPGSPV